FAFHPLVELNGFVTMKFGKVIFPNEDVFLLKNGYWAFTKDKISSEETKQTADHIAGLSQYCSEAGIRFLYVQPPAKVSKYDPEIPDGAENYENQNYDALLGELQKLGIPALDLRAQIDAENLDHYSLFYRTDHHWKVESALWACGEIAERLNTIYSCGLDVTKTDKNLYRTKIYRDWFLGSAGRRVSLGCAKPEDFSILLPNFKTALNIRVPNAEINKTGKFEDVIYNKQVLETKDYYNLSCYESQLYGNQPLTQIKNEENPGGPKILVLGDSFSLAMVPYLSLTAGETDLIDFRQDQGNFSGSIQTYIDQMKPDVVLLAYEPGASYSLK
ncbi:MAG: DHHW family protein, partial [Oscillospiraceae bacterium]|nr:DHHW family protein [Oscillospiraceae bacterium]